MPPPPTILPGDLVFKQSTTDQAKAIQEITRSRYTHCGIIVERNGKLRVAEAINPVRVIGTPANPLSSVEDWIHRGVDQHGVIKRISGGLSAEQLELLEVEMRKSDGKKYDGRFQWNDNAIYCSEFIYDSFNNVVANHCWCSADLWRVPVGRPGGSEIDQGALYRRRHSFQPRGADHYAGLGHG